MKNLVLLALLIAFANVSFAQYDDVYETNKDKEIQTLFKNDYDNGAYFGFGFEMGMIDDKETFIGGAQLAWIIDHNFALGIAGYGFSNNLETDSKYNNFYSGGYGGILMEPIIGAKFPVHLAFPMIAGIGAVSSGYEKYDSYYDEWDYYSEDVDAFLVFKPGAEVEFNVVRFMRINFGAYYTFTTEVDLPDTNKEVLDGLSAGVKIKFGSF